MIKSFLILAVIVVVSSMYALFVVAHPVDLVYSVAGIDLDVSTPNIVTYHIPLACFDFLAILWLWNNRVKYLTEMLVIILCASFISHTVGAFAFVAYNDYVLTGYEFGRIMLLAAELLAFTFYGIYTACSGRNDLGARIDFPGFHVVEND